MQSETKMRLAMAILIVASALGLLADALLRETAWGINLTFWIGCLLAGLFAAKRAGGGTLEFGSAILLAPMAIFAACFAWRDSTMLLARVAGSVLNLGAHCVAGFAHLVARDIDWTQRRSSAVASNARGAAVGVLIALPLLAIFTALFVRADAAFESFYTDILNINLAPHLIPIAIGTWVAGSYLRGVLVPPAPSAEMPPKLRPFQLGATELNVALGLLNALFAMFVAVQAQYLFGNAQTIESTPGLTLAGYARRGFFELVTVALLVLPLLLAGDTLHAAEKSKRIFRLQSFILVCFVFCVMASALLRMRLYQQEYGLTELRWHTTAFMFWLAAVFVLFCLTVLRDLRGLFAMGTVASGFVAIFILHVANPDRWIAEANMANARAGRRFDPEYFRFLSADAAPAVIAGEDVIPKRERALYLARMKKEIEQTSDWRAWNYARHSAGIK